MTVRADGARIRLEGDCHVEDAETLLQLLHATPEAVADLSDCHRLHAAVLQVLLSFRVPLAVEPADDALRAHVTPSLRRSFDMDRNP